MIAYYYTSMVSWVMSIKLFIKLNNWWWTLSQEGVI